MSFCIVENKHCVPNQCECVCLVVQPEGIDLVDKYISASKL